MDDIETYWQLINWLEKLALKVANGEELSDEDEVSLREGYRVEVTSDAVDWLFGQAVSAARAGLRDSRAGSQQRVRIRRRRWTKTVV